jgi:hypothetical protein
MINLITMALPRSKGRAWRKTLARRVCDVERQKSRSASRIATERAPVNRDLALIEESRMDETSIDRSTMVRLAKALEFICGPEHPTASALKAAGETGAAQDIKNARTLFLRLKPSDRREALSMIAE